mgnify:CR=1 FL=1
MACYGNYIDWCGLGVAFVSAGFQSGLPEVMGWPWAIGCGGAVAAKAQFRTGMRPSS